MWYDSLNTFINVIYIILSLRWNKTFLNQLQCKIDASFYPLNDCFAPAIFQTYIGEHKSTVNGIGRVCVDYENSSYTLKVLFGKTRFVNFELADLAEN